MKTHPLFLRLLLLALLICVPAWAQNVTTTPERASGGGAGRLASPAAVNPAPAAPKTAPAPGKTQQLTSPDQTPQGLARSDWQSIRAAYEAGRHAFQPTEHGWQARNPGQQWTTRFDGRGFLTTPSPIANPKSQIADPAWQWGLELESYGWGEVTRAIAGTPAVQAEGQRLSYQWDATVQEWWVNDTRGLEHGWTVKARPESGTGVSPVSLTAGTAVSLSLTIGVRGTLTPKVAPDALGVFFQDSSGATVLHYSGLKVTDADGKALASRFEPAGAGRVRLRVEDRAARYPITIDPLAQQAYLKASQVNEKNFFGRSVAVSGDTVVVGAPLEDSSTTGINSTPNEGVLNAGAVYIFANPTSPPRR